MTGALENAPLVLCRSAFASDRDAVRAFLDEIWGSEDYVLEVLDEWMHDAAGLLAVAERNGRVVGMGHLADLGGGEWWLEGLRVDPSAQGQSVGSNLHDYFVGRWLARGGDVVRLATSDDKVPVHKMCERTGFELRARVRGLQAEARQGGHRFRALDADSVPRALDSLLQSQSVQAGGGLLDLGWRFVQVAPERIRTEPLQLWDWADGQVLLGTIIEQLEDPPELVVATVGADPSDDLAQCLQELPSLSGELGLAVVKWLVPAETWLEHLARTAGFEPNNDHAVRIYERRR